MSFLELRRQGSQVSMRVARVGVAFQHPPGCQASSRGEAKDSAVLLSRDAGLLDPQRRVVGMWFGAFPGAIGLGPFHTVHGALKARILKWFAIPFSSGPRFVRTLHHDLSILGGPTRHG